MLFKKEKDKEREVSVEKIPVQDRVALQHEKNVANNFLAGLRRFLPSSSAVVPVINDFSLYLKLEGNAYIPVSEIFDVTKVADKARLSVRMLYPEEYGLKFILSIKKDIPRFWLGNSEVIEALLRNLLLYAGNRQNNSLAVLRIEHGQDQYGISSLMFLLEDNKKMPGFKREDDSLPFQMIKRITEKLNGSFSLVELEGGLQLKGRVPIKPSRKSLEIMKPDNSAEARIVLMVEDDRANRFVQKKLFEDAGCKVFAVSNGTEALEWAAVLPFSLIALDSMLPVMSGAGVAAGLRRMMRDGLLRNVPIIAITANNSADEEVAWHNVGVSRILLKPISANDIAGLFSYIKKSEPFFYEARDSTLDVDLLGSSYGRLPELRKELGKQVMELCHLLERKGNFERAAEQAHAVKSASLSLGYYRLSGLAAAMENSIKYENTTQYTPNFEIIKDCLTAEFKD